MRHGKNVAIISFGVMLEAALEAADTLDATVVDMRWVKPLDETLLRQIAAEHELLVTVEDHQVMTGAGSAVNELFNKVGLNPRIKNLGLPDEFIDHGKREDLLAQLGLDAAGIVAAVQA